jgi:putative transcriptional regulator
MSADGLAPTLLLAMPQLDDPNFARAVVLLCKHGEDGALGFIVNRPIDTVASKIISLEPPVRSDTRLTVWEGGPVSQERGWLICRNSPENDDGIAICDGLYMSSSQATLRRILEGDPSESEQTRSRLLLGYAGWGPGQLDSELTASAWLTVPLDVSLIFDTPADLLWERAIRTLGVEPSAIAPAPGVH